MSGVRPSAPYFHDGLVADLREAVQVMAQVQAGARLPDSEVESVMAFLQALTGEVPEHFSAPDRFPGR